MSHLRHFMRAILAGVLLPVVALAQTSPSPGDTNLTPTAKPLERDGRIVVSDQQALDFGVPTTSIERQKLPPDIKARLARFEAIRDAYRKEQDDLRAKERGAVT